MALRVVAQVDGRYEDRLARMDDGFAAATNRAVVRWSTAGDELADTVVHVSEEYHPGPLAWLADAGKLAWGPTLLDGNEPVWAPLDIVAVALADVGSGAARHFSLSAGAVSADARHVAVVLERQHPRVVASRAKQPAGPALRVAVVDATTGDLIEILDEPARAPGAIAWADGPLLLGMAGKVIVRGGEPLVVGDGSAPRSLAVSTAGTITAGAASGRIFTRAMEWQAHEGPVIALAWQGDDVRLATGGTDGWVRVWSPLGENQAALQLGAQVEALAWLNDQALVAKAGGQAGRIYLLGLDA